MDIFDKSKHVATMLGLDTAWVTHVTSLAIVALGTVFPFRFSERHPSKMVPCF